jgi:hypothetical protein
LKKKTQRKSYHHRVPGSKLELLVTGAFRRNSEKRRAAAFSLAKEVPSAYREMDARNDIPGGNPKTAIAGL